MRISLCTYHHVLRPELPERLSVEKVDDRSSLTNGGDDDDVHAKPPVFLLRDSYGCCPRSCGRHGSSKPGQGANRGPGRAIWLWRRRPVSVPIPVRVLPAGSLVRLLRAGVLSGLLPRLLLRIPVLTG